MRRYTARQVFAFAETDFRRLTTSVRFVFDMLFDRKGKPRKTSKSPAWRGRKRSRKSDNVYIHLDDPIDEINARAAPWGIRL